MRYPRILTLLQQAPAAGNRYLGYMEFLDIFAVRGRSSDRPRGGCVLLLVGLFGEFRFRAGNFFDAEKVTKKAPRDSAPWYLFYDAASR